MTTDGYRDLYDKLWHPVTGCDPVSPGCDRCRAKRSSELLRGIGKRKGLFAVRTYPEQLQAPLEWTGRQRVLAGWDGDLFHRKVPNEFIAAVFGVMAASYSHTFLLLTKRLRRALEWFEWVAGEGRLTDGCMRSDLADYAIRAAGSLPANVLMAGAPFAESSWPLPNVWFGASVEDQPRAEQRVPLLRQIPAAVRYVNVEPMLGHVSLDMIGHHVGGHPGTLNALTGEWWPAVGDYEAEVQGIEETNSVDWVTCAGECGKDPRPLDLGWARDLRDQCRDAKVPFYFKGVGNNTAHVPDDLMVREELAK